jgi:hypothetical protein
MASDNDDQILLPRYVPPKAACGYLPEVSSSVYIGVTWNGSNGNWNAQYQGGGVHMHLGCFKLEEDAALAYDDAIRETHVVYVSFCFII